MTRRWAAGTLLLGIVLSIAWLRTCGEAESAPPDDVAPPRPAELATSDAPDGAAPTRRRVTAATPGGPVTPPPGPPPTTGQEAPPTAGPEPKTVRVEAVDVTVVDADGNPLEGAEVVIFEDHPRGGWTYWRQCETARTDATGRATLTVSGGVALQLRTTHGELEESTSVAIKSETGRVAVRARLRKGMRAVGRVVDADTLAPIAGAIVELFRAPWSQQATTDRDGRYVSGPVHQDALLLLALSDPPDVLAPGYASRPASQAYHNRVMELRLTPTTRVSFRLVSGDGEPVAGRSGHVKTRRGHTGHLFETNDVGVAHVDVVLEPDAALEVRPKDAAFVVFPSTPERTVARELGDVRVVAAGTIEGVVVNTTGEPVRAATLWLTSGSGGGYALDIETSDIDGIFELENVGPGDHVITATTRLNDEIEVRIERIHAGTRDVRIVLPTRDD